MKALRLRLGSMRRLATAQAAAERAPKVGTAAGKAGADTRPDMNGRNLRMRHPGRRTGQDVKFLLKSFVHQKGVSLPLKGRVFSLVR